MHAAQHRSTVALTQQPLAGLADRLMQLSLVRKLPTGAAAFEAQVQCMSAHASWAKPLQTIGRCTQKHAADAVHQELLAKLMQAMWLEEKGAPIITEQLRRCQQQP